MRGNFAEIMEFVLTWEGGLTNDAHDRGGVTNFGITQRDYPDVVIEDLTREGAIRIYERDYWPRIAGDSLPWPLDLAVMDFGVNSGPNRAVRYLQRALGCGLVEDGVPGPKTVAAVINATARGQAAAVAREVNESRRRYLNKIVAKDATQEKFLEGWLNRVAALQVECLRGPRREAAARV